MEISADIIIVGTGVAGLFHALNLPKDMKIIMITKSEADESDSFLAQGGICVLKDEKDYESFYYDTLKAGHFENNPDSVEIMIRTSPEIIKDLINYGVEFEKKDGKLVYTKEGAHSTARILYHEDLTGKEITSKLLEEVRKRKNITIYENTTMVDILTDCNIVNANGYKISLQEEDCTNKSDITNKVNFIESNNLIESYLSNNKKESYSNPTTLKSNIKQKYNKEFMKGIVVRNSKQELQIMYATYITLATGGIGGIYESSTNYRHLTGDAIAIALKHGIELKNVNYVQIHPTSLYSEKPGRRFLISESVRGEGAVLYNKKMERFVDELLPRDVLTNKIREQMKKENSKHVWLSIKHMNSDEIIKRFPNIYKRCLEEGYDITKECIPVTPAQHYYMGGIKVDMNSKTSMEHLYAIGETSCNGVHGANRLASNSLLESLVFAKRAATHITKNYKDQTNHSDVHEKKIQDLTTYLSRYQDQEKIEKEYKEIILQEIERVNQYERYHNKEA